ncbi:MAG: tRNA (guanine-N(7)-)-methyltransferase [Cellvibrionales bacterium UBA7375]|nr:tRNA (guanosine(46)-N7)-methyltransferase TrmB [Gammaproteobacteria bacterium]CAI8166253.1 MAG: tRNA (guanine-N(7)-)-methyltransferase [Cellvibrionales bacterium UBA7375]
MEIKPEYRDKTIRSFVVRAGRMTKAQRSAFELGWDTYGLRLADEAIELDTVFGRNNPKVVEIGFGMGGSLLEMVEAQPDTDFIGIEVHPPGVGSLINAAQEKNISNLRVYLADATDVLNECFADGSLDRVQIYFPDPWHKKKHNKRRIIQPKFLQLIREKLRLGGIVHMATDWQPYAEQMLELVGEADGFKNMAQDYVPRPDFRPLTKFERRGERLGHGVWDLMAERTL